MTKVKITQQQRDNQLEERDVMWPSVPEANVYAALNRWGHYSRKGPPTRGTVACFGGWAEAWPPFREQLGLADGKSSSWHRLAELFLSYVDDDDYYDDYDHIADKTFNTRGYHPADKGFKGTDHALVSNRLNWIIENSVVV